MKDYLFEIQRKLLKSPGRGEMEMFRAARALGLRVKRQQNVGRYFADLAIPSIGLIIEVDGRDHLQKDKRIRDKQRTKQIRRQKWTVARVASYAAEERPIEMLVSVLVGHIGVGPTKQLIKDRADVTLYL